MWLHMILDNGVHETKCNVNCLKELCHYYLEVKDNTTYYQCMIRVIIVRTYVINLLGTYVTI